MPLPSDEAAGVARWLSPVRERTPTAVIVWVVVAWLSVPLSGQLLPSMVRRHRILSKGRQRPSVLPFYLRIAIRAATAPTCPRSMRSRATPYKLEGN